MTNPRKTPRIAAAAGVAALMLTAFAALGGVGLAQTSGGPGKAQYDPNKKTQVCHKGKKTLTIGKAAAAAHLRHGDTPGTCASAAAKAKKAKAAKAAKAKAAKAQAAKAAAAKKKAEKAAAAPAAKGKGKGK